MTKKSVLVTGATGYIGGRLVPALLESGYRVRAMGRSLEKMAQRPWGGHPRVELVRGDVLKESSLKEAAGGCGVAYYLVHSMIAKKGKYAQADRLGARNMVSVAEEVGIERIIYLGGLGETGSRKISRHLKSRHEVGQILARGKVPVTALRAAMILGSGSASFEILRYLVERLPVMITPRWVHMPTQPIAVRNVLGYLAGCLEREETTGETYDIGGPDVLTYADLFRLFAEVAGLRPRKVIPVPVLTPGLSARWIHLVSPVPASIAQPLAEGLSIPTVCTESRIRELIPQELMDCRSAVATALEGDHRVRSAATALEGDDRTQGVATALGGATAHERGGRSREGGATADCGEEGEPSEWARCGDADWAGGTTLDSGLGLTVRATARELWETVRRIGGENGWYGSNLLWRMRGAMDEAAGGSGLRRGRRHPTELLPGDVLDFWRVLEVVPDKRLLLLAEMKAPGEALLDIRLEEKGEGLTELSLVSRFLPRGLAGLLYWHALYPAHLMVFTALLKGIAGVAGKETVGIPRRFAPPKPDPCTSSTGNIGTKGVKIS